MRISDWSSDVCSSDLFSFGALLMLGFSLGLGEATMYDWGWRIPFFVAGPMGLVGMYLRSRMEDTPIFREIEMAGEEEQSTSAELKDLLLGYRSEELRGGKGCCSQVSFRVSPND